MIRVYTEVMAQDESHRGPEILFRIFSTTLELLFLDVSPLR